MTRSSRGEFGVRWFAGIGADTALSGLWLVFLSCCFLTRATGAQFDAASFGLPLPEGNGVMWEDPRELHRVVVHFAGPPPAPEKVRLEYWGSRWPEQRLPKDREPGGGDTEALRALFNGQAVSYFPDVRMNTEHALPDISDWRGDHFKSSDESNVAGWLRYLFVREEGDTLLIGQAVPCDWLRAGKKCGIERAATYFGKTSVLYEAGQNQITARVDGPTRNPPKQIRLRFGEPNGRLLNSVDVNGKPWKILKGEWVALPGNIGKATLVAKFSLR